jgi:hypothetical protein
VYKPLFPGQVTAIVWLAYVEPSGRCRAEEFIALLPGERRGKLQARMLAWASHGNWNSKVPFVKRMTVSISIPVYEVKSHQERLLFIRCGNDAVAIDGFVKKDDWSKKDAATLDAAMKLVTAAAADCKGGKR